MAYNVYFVCEKCGKGYNWVNVTVSLDNAIKLARRCGWQVGKNGWFCNDCKTRKKAGIIPRP